MTRLQWGEVGSHRYEAGVDRGVFYPRSGPGLVWNGLISVDEKHADEDQTFIYYDGEKIRSQLTIGSFAATLSAFTYPYEFEDYQGVFGLSYRTGVGDELSNLDRGYRIHVVYNALAKPTQRNAVTIGSNADPMAFTWDISTMPVELQFARPSAHLVIDSTIVNPGVMADVEALLYGTETTSAHFPTFQQLLDIFDAHALFKIINHGDGTFTAIGPDDAVFLTASTEFQLDWPSVVMISEDTYRASSY